MFLSPGSRLRSQLEHLWKRLGTSVYYLSGNVGIGTKFPLALFDVSYNITKPQAPQGGLNVLRITAADGSPAAFVGDSFGQSSFFVLQRASGTAANKTATLGGQANSLAGNFYDGSIYATGAGIDFKSWNNWSGTDHSAMILFNTTPISSTTEAEAARFHASGGLCVGTTTDPGFGGYAGSNDRTIVKASGVLSDTLTATLSTVSVNYTGNGGVALYLKDSNAGADLKFFQINSAAGVTRIASLTDAGALKKTILSGDHATGNIVSDGTLKVAQATAIPAGGTQDVGYSFSSTAHFGLYFGSGAPTATQAKGSIYLRSDGPLPYVNTDGGTTWAQLAACGTAAGTSAAPASTTSTTGVMMGLGLIAGFSYTPKTSGNILVFIGGTASTATASTTATMTGKQGTGTAPSNAAAPSGTTFGINQITTGLVGAGIGFIVMGKITGLAIGTAVWFDLVLATGVAADAASVKNLQCIVIEVP